MNDDVMTIKEISSYLKLKEKTVYALAGKGKIPSFKAGGALRFRKSKIEKWIKAQEEK